MTTFLIIAIIAFICFAAAVLDHASGMDKPRSSRKPKKKSFFASWGESSKNDDFWDSAWS